MAKIVILNMKNAFSKDKVENYIFQINKEKLDNINFIICPSFLYLNYFNNTKFSLGAQNVYYDDDLCTGEVSIKELKNIGVDYVIVGHCERRVKLMENDLLINKKIKCCLNNNIKPILCIGESFDEKNKNKTYEVLKNQILTALGNLDKNMISNIIIAYEPIYAIGNNNTLDLENIKEVINYIKQILLKEFNISLNIIYGGSVNKTNISNIINIFDGVMVCNMGLNYNEFVKIIKNI